MEKHLVEELQAQLQEHDEVVVTDMDGNILDAQNIHWDSRNGRVEIQVEVPPRD